MPSSSSSSSSSSVSYVYDVFLSFRGEDTRKNFVDHLYSALDQRYIRTYKDDITLPKGESVGPALLKAIQESRCVQTFYGHVANRPPTWNDSSPWFMYTAVSGYGLMKQ
ncbi:Toll/interleukin-1 receptor domain-containing protein [Tanacetum coccineum]